jgi:hypothetical protein
MNIWDWNPGLRTCKAMALLLSYLFSTETIIVDIRNSILERGLGYQWLYEAKSKTNIQSTKMNEILSLAAPWMGLEDIM